jgi:uncharacterized membrane protein YfcA
VTAVDTLGDVDAFVRALFHVSPGFLVAVVVVGFFGFVVSATFGIGGVVLLIPMLSLALPPAQAVALSAPVMLVNNLGKSLVYRRHVDRRALFYTSALALPAAFVAALWTVDVDDRALLLGVAALILVTLWVERVRETPVRMSPRGLLWWGLVTGGISGLCGAAGPPTAIGLRGYGLTKDAFVGTVSVFAVFLQLFKMPAYVATDVLPARMMPLAAVLAGAAVVAVRVGPRLLSRVPPAVFRNVVDGILLVSAGWLVVDAVRRF